MAHQVATRKRARSFFDDDDGDAQHMFLATMRPEKKYCRLSSREKPVPMPLSFAANLPSFRGGHATSPLPARPFAARTAQVPSQEYQDIDMADEYDDQEDDEYEDDDQDDDTLSMTISPPPTSATFIPLPRSARLSPRIVRDSTNGGRVPTPIYSSFKSSYARAVKPLPPRSTSSITSSPQIEPISSQSQAQGSKVPLKDLALFDRPLPSPISEANVETPTTILTETQLSRLSVSGTGGDPGSIEGIMEVEYPGLKRGRSRSGAITDKRRFAMGYREDCEKCRLKVPGHYSHFLPA